MSKFKCYLCSLTYNSEYELKRHQEKGKCASKELPGNCKILSDNTVNDVEIKKIIKFQALWRGYNTRIKRLPTLLYVIKDFLLKNPIKFSEKNSDGRVNSCKDEITVSNLLKKKFGDRIIISKTNTRFWFDILIKDHRYGWLPVNIKTTRFDTCSDNSGNLSIVVQAYTDYMLNLDRKTTYTNGEM